ncbi:hypothetical protein OH492_27450 [Vibrio chagasii]|nr:hypothetical protein [Vibrio chagasii]
MRSTLDDHAIKWGWYFYLRRSSLQAASYGHLLRSVIKRSSSKGLTVKTNPVEKLISWHQVSSKRFQQAHMQVLLLKRHGAAFWSQR